MLGITGFQFPCDQQAFICPNKSVEFTCTTPNVGFMTWIVPDTDSDLQLDLLLVLVNPDLQYNAMDIYNASIVESTDSNITSVLTFVPPIKLNNNNMEIICARGTGNSQGDRMSCPFIIAGTLVIMSGIYCNI